MTWGPDEDEIRRHLRERMERIKQEAHEDAQQIGGTITDMDMLGMGIPPTRPDETDPNADQFD